ncbi:MAG TPA: 4Fe-4S binding protein, partial [Telluria sp.]|nr:4Fe-4S binding protein [Telluria sp.]
CVRSRADIEIAGYLGAFAVRWRSGNALLEGQFDLILDLCDPPLLARHTLPHGYFAPGLDDEARAAVIGELAGMTGVFEKPKYFVYRAARCGHGRNGKTGCSACIDVCSAEAITSAGERIDVDTHLCAGCGACASTCPSGAISYAYPGVAYTGERARAMLAAYAAAGGAEPILVLHDAANRAVAEELPDHALPLELHHVTAAGLDVWLAALCHGARGVLVLTGAHTAPGYLALLEEQAALAQHILHGLGYPGRHVVVANDAATLPQGAVPAQLASFHVMPDKRNTLDFALGHLHAHAPAPPDMLDLPARAPFGAVQVDTAKCSLCMACVGACPSSALTDNPSFPRLSFIESNCIQCGLCVATCPEQAIELAPRLNFTPTRQQARTLYESAPFCCISCGKPFGTALLVETMLRRLSGHAAFRAHPDRLRMCSDCRVVDMMKTD